MMILDSFQKTIGTSQFGAACACARASDGVMLFPLILFWLIKANFLLPMLSSAGCVRAVLTHQGRRRRSSSNAPAAQLCAALLLLARCAAALLLACARCPAGKYFLPTTVFPKHFCWCHVIC